MHNEIHVQIIILRKRFKVDDHQWYTVSENEPYLYRRDKRFAAKQHWLCTVRGCGARVHADYADPPIILKETGLSHPPDDELACSRRLKTEMCKTARETPLVPLTQVSFYTFITSI